MQLSIVSQVPTNIVESIQEQTDCFAGSPRGVLLKDNAWHSPYGLLQLVVTANLQT